MPRQLTSEQDQAVRLEKKPTALLAGAGSGKTMVLVERYIAALQRGTRPHQMLTVTFTNEAADQLRERIIKELNARHRPSGDLLEQIETTPYIGTIHSFCYRVLDQYGSQLGLPAIEKIITGQEWSEAFDESYQEWLKEIGQEKVRALLQHFSSRDLRGLAWDLFHHRDEFREAAPHLEEPIWELVRSAYLPFLDKLEHRLSSQGHYGFDDLERYAYRLLRDSEEARQRFQQQFQYLLVDEFQDTSRRQWEILSYLVGDQPEKIFVVGDPKQSIYGFRQADVQLFLELNRRFGREGGQSLALTVNFRSEPGLLRQINARSGPLFEGSAIPFEPMQSLRAEDNGRGLRVARFKKDGEVERAVGAVKWLIDNGSPPEDIALLFRNSDRISLYLEALAKLGIPARCSRRDELFHCLDVLHLAAYLRALHDPTDSFHVAAFFRSPFIGMNYETLFKISQFPGNTLWEKAKGISSLSWLHAWKDGGETSANAALAALFSNTSYWPEQEEAFGALLAGLEAEEDMDLPTAVQRLLAWEKNAVTFEREESAETSAVRLMTVHGAKGLEFPHVLLVDTLRQPPRSSPLLRFAPDFPPGIKYREKDETIETPAYTEIAEMQNQREQEEARRILYVALTRAQSSLTLLLPEEEVKQPKGSWADLLDPREEKGK